MRPRYGDVFSFDRLLNVSFYTSNIHKLLQARLIFSRFGYELYHFRGKNEPYDENYQLGTVELLRKAIKQVRTEFGIQRVFFVEDTSLRVEALSTPHSDSPGLAVKDWFSKTSFEELDRILRLRDNNRKATVKSDIALSLPTLNRPIFFHGETSGTIAGTPPSFDENPQYPWLTPHTFNGWFIPDGSSRRLGEMEFEESIDYDFRAKTLVYLIQRLEEINASLSLSSSFIRVRRPAPRDQQALLFTDLRHKVFIVLGLKCAGKSTFADHCAMADDIQVFEASTILRKISEDMGESVGSDAEALQFLNKHGRDVVARYVSDVIEKIPDKNVVITGFRTIEEIQFILSKNNEAHIVNIECDEKIRFERHIKRSRDNDIQTLIDLRNQDERQMRFGALRVANDISDTVIRNETSILDYKAHIENIIRGRQAKTSAYRRRIKASELYRCLSALAQINRTATCEEISAATKKYGTQVRKYNTNRALKQAPEFAERIIKKNAILSYRILPAARSYLSLCDTLIKTR